LLGRDAHKSFRKNSDSPILHHHYQDATHALTRRKRTGLCPDLLSAEERMTQHMLSQEEKEQIQCIIAEQNKILAGAPTFAAKRAAQKAKIEAMTKLGMIPKKP